MLNNKEQIIEAGDHSTNVQGHKVTVNQSGMDYLHVRQVAMDVFKSNFYDLGEKVEEIIIKRAEKLLNDYLEKLKTKAPKSIINTQDVDIRYNIYEAQKNYARLNNEEMEALLVDLLVERTKAEKDEFKKLVLNQALEIIPKLTAKQIDSLTIIFFVRNIVFTNVNPQFKEYVDLVTPFLELSNYTNDLTHLRHLQSTGCIAIDAGSVKFHEIMIENFPNIFPDQESFEAEISKYEIIGDLRSKWDNILCHCSLSSVGLAIAIINLNNKVNSQLNLGIWVRE